jgi:hypothetical protein
MPNATSTESSVPAKGEGAPSGVSTCEAGRRPLARKYFTDGTHLYEIVCTVLAYRLGRGPIRETILRDCVTEATAKIDDLQLAALSLVR